MPKRPRSHRLETESELAFQQAIPSRWVYRRKEKDYGIDGEVEIFDDSGRATGSVFLVQLKATDSDNRRLALRVWLRRETAHYYASLGLPVLIVRYHAPSASLYARWFHSLDSYYGKKTSKGVTFHLDAENLWGPSTAGSIERSVTAFRDTNQSAPTLPIEIRVQISEPVVHGISRAELVMCLAAAARGVARIVRLEFPTAISVNDPNRVQLTADRIAVFIGDRPGVTIHTPAWLRGPPTREALASDVLMAIGLGLDWLDHPALGADILVAFNSGSSLTRLQPTAHAVVRCLRRARRGAELLAIARRLILSDNERPIGDLFLTAALIEFASEGQSRATAIASVGELACELAERGQNERAAAVHYSCGNALRSHDLRAALTQYRCARALDASYEQRDYFEAELAGVLFLLGRYKLAAHHYHRALELRPDRQTKLRYADALLFSGRYRDALDLLTQAAGGSQELEDAEWVLKHYALNYMLGRGVPNTQVRQRVASQWVDAGSATYEEVARACELVLHEDALSGHAWLNLGTALYQSGNLAAARDCYLVAALASPGDIESWTAAAGVSLMLHDGKMAGLILFAGYQLNEESFILHMLERVPEEQRDRFGALMNEMRELLQGVGKEPYIMRFHMPDGTWTEIPIERN
jgi:tetratricopeptide (TPR) repeat protein